MRGSASFRPAAVACGIADLDQGVSERMFERAVRGLARGGQQRGTADLVADSPSASAAARRLCIEEASSSLISRGTAARSRQSPPNGSRPGGRFRRGRPGTARTMLAAVGVVDPRRGPDGVAPAARAT